MFYGWIIVALAFVAQFVVTGAVIQCFPVFLLPLGEEFGVGRAGASLPIVVMMLCGVVISPFVGRAVVRFPIRHVMLAGALAMALGFFGLSRATEWWQVLVLYGTAGAFSMGALGPVACNSIVVNWFERQRAMALGIAMMGMSISGAVLIPTATWVLSEWGWRAAYLGFAGLVVALMPFIVWLGVTRPSEMGLVPDGDVGGATRTGVGASQPRPLPASHAPASTRQLLASKALWLIAAACGLIFFGSMGLMNHGMAFAVDRGIDPMGAAVLLSAISVGAALGKLLFGWIAGAIGERGGFYVAIACQLVALLGFLELSGYAALVASAGFYGLGIGGVAPLQAALLARGFGAGNFGPVMGLIGPLTIPFQIAGPPLAGFIFDSQGSYDTAIQVFFAAALVSALVLSRVRMPEPAASGPLELGVRESAVSAPAGSAG